MQKIDIFFKIYCWQNIETLSSALPLEQWTSGVCGELSCFLWRTKKWEDAEGREEDNQMGAEVAEKIMKKEGFGCGEDNLDGVGRSA